MRKSTAARVAKLEAKQPKSAGTFPDVVKLKWNQTCEQRHAELEAEGYIYDPKQLVVWIQSFDDGADEEDLRTGSSPASEHERYSDYGASNDDVDI